MLSVAAQIMSAVALFAGSGSTMAPVYYQLKLGLLDCAHLQGSK
jgi:hypothetical protein